MHVLNKILQLSIILRAIKMEFIRFFVKLFSTWRSEEIKMAAVRVSLWSLGTRSVKTGTSEEFTIVRERREFCRQRLQKNGSKSSLL